MIKESSFLIAQLINHKMYDHVLLSNIVIIEMNFFQDNKIFLCYMVCHPEYQGNIIINIWDIT